MMNQRIEIALFKRKLLEDEFRKKNGYSWDYVIVFEVHKSKDKLADVQKKNSMKFIIDRLHSAGLETRLFFSAQYDEVYCKIRVHQDRLLNEAHRTKYKLLAEPNCLSNKLAMGNQNPAMPSEKHWSAVEIPDDRIETKIGPFEYMYLDYNNVNADVTAIFKVYENKSVLRGIDRLKLISGIIQARRHLGGCHLDMGKLANEKCILGFFPLHDIVELRRLEDKWLTFIEMPWNQNLEVCRNYYGEKVAFYFGWLGHYTSWLLPAGILGFFSWIGVATLSNNPSAPNIPFFAAFIAIWSTLFLEFWKRKEKRYSMMWGTEQYENEESERPNFIGVPSVSPVDGSHILYFSKFSFYTRIYSSALTIAVLIVVVIGVIIGIIFAGVFMTNSDNQDLAASSPVIGGLLNAVQIQVLNAIYSRIAIFLTDYENHRTNTSYENSLMAKTFIFQFVNSFASLFYIAFVRPFIPQLDPCPGGDCLKVLQASLGSIFLTKLATGSVLSLLVPYIMEKMKERGQSVGVDKSDLTEVELQFLLGDYDVTLGTFADYAELTMQFGYVTMFITAYPLATILAFVNNYVEMRVDAWKMCAFLKRPEPRGADNIGTWYFVLEIISFSAVLVNSALVASTGTFALTFSWAARVWIFVGMSTGIIIIKTVVSGMVADIPRDVEIQLERKSFIESKVVHNTPDEYDDSLFKKTKIKNEFTIRITDDDPL